jgi:hypothetical protein
MTSRPAVKPALVTRPQRARCAILVAAMLAACSPPVARRPAVLPPVPRAAYTQLVPELTGAPRLGNTMGFYVSTCLFQNDPNCLQIIFGIGEITAKTPDHFVAFTQALQDVLPGGIRGQWGVLLDSAGGDVAGAIDLGTQFRLHNWNTVVGLDYPLAGQWRIATCASACVYAVAGGLHRFVLKDNVLAVHQFRESSVRLNVAQVQYLSAALGVYLTRMGVSTNLQNVAGLTLPGDLTTLTIRDALALGLATTGG